MKHVVRGFLFWLAVVLLGGFHGPNWFGAMVYVTMAGALTSLLVEKSS